MVARAARRGVADSRLGSIFTGTSDGDSSRC
jgi:hypothetical protein